MTGINIKLDSTHRDRLDYAIPLYCGVEIISDYYQLVKLNIPAYNY
jgi:hypothetical protein